MKKSVIIMLAVVICGFFSSCGTTKSTAFAGMYDEKPTVLLLMPPINNSTNVEAKEFFYTTLTVPISESGYYVLSPAMTLATLQRESAYDSERFIEGDLKKFGEIFGADVAVFTIINKWDKNVIGKEIVIEVEYIFKSTKTNEILFDREANMTCKISSGGQGEGLFGAFVVSMLDAIDTALTDYVGIAIECNEQALADIPYGKYHPKYGLDGNEAANNKKMEFEMKK